MLSRKFVFSTAFASLILYLYAQYKRRKDLIFHGQLRLLNAIITAVTDRLFLLPLRRAQRLLLKDFTRPIYLEDFKDSKGKRFLTDVLRQESYLLQNQYVHSVNVVKFSSGQMSSAARLELTYKNAPILQSSTVDTTFSTYPGKPISNAINAPPTIIVKMTRQDIKGKALNMLVGLYRECDCYSTLLPSTGCPVPDIIFSTVNSFSMDFLLILSDGSYVGPNTGYVDSTTVGTLSLAPNIKVDAIKAPGILKSVYGHVPPTNIHGDHINVSNIPIVVDMMKRSCVELSKMHIKYWKDPTLFEMDLSLGNVDSLAEAYAAVISSWQITKKKARSGIYEGTSPWRGEKDMDAFESLVERSLMAATRKWGQENHGSPSAWRIIDAKSYRDDIVCDVNGGYTLLHGDFHAENVFVRTIPKHSSAPEFLILDWQLPSIGDPVKDVARMIVFGALDHLGREKYEMEILKAWWLAFTKEKEDVKGSSGNKLCLSKVYPWELAVLSYKYWAAHHSALLIMTCEISKFFEEDDAAGYRMSVDKFNAICKLHGDPVINFDKRSELLKQLKASTI
jgi:hypothetical protein